MHRTPFGTAALVALAAAACPAPARAQPARVVLGVAWEVDVPRITDQVPPANPANPPPPDKWKAWAADQAKTTAEYLGGLGLPWGFAPADPDSAHRLVFTVRPRNGFRDPDQDIEYLVEYVVKDPALGPVRYPVPKVRSPADDKPLISSGDRNQLLLTVGESKTADTLADRLRLDFCPGGEPREAALQVMKKRIPCAVGAELVDPAQFPDLPAHCMLPHLRTSAGAWSGSTTGSRSRGRAPRPAAGGRPSRGAARGRRRCGTRPATRRRPAWWCGTPARSTGPTTGSTRCSGAAPRPPRPAPSSPPNAEEST